MTSLPAEDVSSLLEKQDFEEPDDPVRTEQFGPEVVAILREPIDIEQVSVLYDGTTYMTHIWYRDRFNRAFGEGGWTVKPIGPWIERNGFLIRDWKLLVLGKYITECSASHRTKDSFDDDLANSRESCRSGAFVRLGKDLGVAKELWNRSWVAKFLAEHVVSVAQQRWKKVDGKWTTHIVQGFRLTTQLPLEGEVGPWLQNERGFYPDDAPNVPLVVTRYAPYTVPEGTKAPEYVKAQSAPATGKPQAAPQPLQGGKSDTPATTTASTPNTPPTEAQGPKPVDPGIPPDQLTEAARKLNLKAVLRSMQMARGKDASNDDLADTLAAASMLVCNGVKCRSFANLTAEQAYLIREAIDSGHYDPKTRSSIK